MEVKLFPHSNTHKGPTTTYVTVLDHICHQIQDTYDYSQDIAESLWKGSKIDLNKHAPTLSKSTNADKTLRIRHCKLRKTSN